MVLRRPKLRVCYCDAIRLLRVVGVQPQQPQKSALAGHGDAASRASHSVSDGSLRVAAGQKAPERSTGRVRAISLNTWFETV